MPVMKKKNRATSSPTAVDCGKRYGSKKSSVFSWSDRSWSPSLSLWREETFTEYFTEFSTSNHLQIVRNKSLCQKKPMKAMSQQDSNSNVVFKQLTEILERSIKRINEVEQHISKDLESIRRQLDAVGVLKDNIANLNNRIDSLSKKLTELSKSEPQELNRMMMRSISELDKRMQMFTVTEVLSRLESGQGFAPRSSSAVPSPAKSAPAAAPAKASKPAPAASPPATPTQSSAPASKGVDAVAEAAGSDQPWREKMREKYGLKKKPGKV
jgi:hypothetical protein